MNRKKSGRKLSMKFMKIILVFVLLVPTKVEFGYELHKHVYATENILLRIKVS